MNYGLSAVPYRDVKSAECLWRRPQWHVSLFGSLRHLPTQVAIDIECELGQHVLRTVVVDGTVLQISLHFLSGLLPRPHMGAFACDTPVPHRQIIIRGAHGNHFRAP